MSRKTFLICLGILGIGYLWVIGWNPGERFMGKAASPTEELEEKLPIETPAPEGRDKETAGPSSTELPPPNIVIEEKNIGELMGLGMLEEIPILVGVETVDLIFVEESPQQEHSQVVQSVSTNSTTFTDKYATNCTPQRGFEVCETLKIISIFKTNMTLTVVEMINNESTGGNGVDRVIVPADTRWSFNEAHPSNYGSSGGYNKGTSGGYIVGAGACNVATVINGALERLDISTYNRPHILNVGGTTKYVPIPRADGTYFPKDWSVVIQAGTSGDLRFTHNEGVEMLFEVNQNSIVVHARTF